MPKGNSWTYSEMEILKENATSMSVPELMELLPGRSKKAIYRAIERLQAKGVLGYKMIENKRKPKSKKDGGWGDSDWGDSTWD